MAPIKATARPVRHDVPQQRAPGARKAAASAVRTAGGLAPSALHAGASLMGGVYHNMISPLISWMFGLLRGVTSLQASLAGCLAVAGLLVSLSGIATLGTLGLARHYMHIKTHIIRPLDFDYSSPIAIAKVSIKDPPRPPNLLAAISEILGYTNYGNTEDLQHYLNDHMPGIEVNGRPANSLPVQVGQYDRFPYSQQYMKPTSGDYKSSRPGHDNGPWQSSSIRNDHPKLQQPTRALEPKQPVSVHVVLDLPSEYHDLFQITAELVSEDGHVVARQSRTYMPHRTPFIKQLIRNLVTLPGQLLGYGSPPHRVSLKVIDWYVEQAAAPLAQVRVLLTSRNASVGVLPPPPVYKGQLDVALRLGLFKRLLTWLSPSWLFTAVVGGAAAVVTVISGSIAMLLLIVAAFLHRIGRPSRSSAELKRQQQLHDEQAAKNRQLAQELSNLIERLNGPQQFALPASGERAAVRPAAPLLADVGDKGSNLRDSPAGWHEELDESKGAAPGSKFPGHDPDWEESHDSDFGSDEGSETVQGMSIDDMDVDSEQQPVAAGKDSVTSSRPAKGVEPSSPRIETPPRSGTEAGAPVLPSGRTTEDGDVGSEGMVNKGLGFDQGQADIKQGRDTSGGERDEIMLESKDDGGMFAALQSQVRQRKPSATVA